MTVGDKEYYYLTRGNMNEDGEIANTTDGSPKAYRSEIAAGILRLDGLYSLDSPYGRTVNATTNVLVYNTNATKLLLNVDASAGGAVWTELRTPDCSEVLLGPSEPITHNSIAAEVQWPKLADDTAGSKVFAELGGRPLVLRFVMEQAKLYTFRFA